MTEANAFEDALVAEMRANDGKVLSGPLAGHPLLILTSKGAKTGALRRAILTYHRDGDDYLVAGTASGAPTTPGWVHNIQADEDVAIEVDNERLDATATILETDERDRLWDDHVKALPWFAAYPAQTGGRVIPMIRLTPRRPGG